MPDDNAIFQDLGYPIRYLTETGSTLPDLRIIAIDLQTLRIGCVQVCRMDAHREAAHLSGVALCDDGDLYYLMDSWI